jgi:ABC-type polysaccharide/polyol phosphate transport system ATPase subunit
LSVTAPHPAEGSQAGASAPPAVIVADLAKSFKLPHQQYSTLKERVLHPFRSTTYDVLHAVKGLSFEVGEGEFFGIVGRNGSGKSTLLKCLAGIYRTDHGVATVRGRLSPFIELGVGFNPDLTARENVLINAVMLGLSRREAASRFDHIIEFAELDEFVDLKLKNYSSGMHVRLAFAVAVQTDADVLLIDEVLAVGDAAFQQKCYDEFNRLRDEGRTILLVTHDMTTVSRFCERAMLLEKGVVVDIGDPDAVAGEYYETNFGRGSAAAAEEPERHHHHQGDGTVEIADAWFEDGDGNRVNALSQGRRAAFVAVVRFVEPHVDPVFAFSLGTDEGDIVFATSTLWEEEHTGSFAAGEHVGFRVAFDNYFAPGRYHASPSIARRGSGQDVHVRVSDLASVVVTGARAGGGLVDIPHEFFFARRDETAGVATSGAPS